MKVARFQTHEAIVTHARLGPGDTLLDLGCGTGHTLVTAVQRAPGIRAVGVDLDAEALALACSRLEALGARARLALADLSQPLPLPEESVTRLVCHDVLEWLRRPMGLIIEAHRVMRPGATAVWSHTDYDSTVVNGADRTLTRRIIHAYADCPQPGVASSDGQLGRQLAALVGRSPFQRRSVDAHVLVRTELDRAARLRIDDVLGVLGRAVDDGLTDLTTEELQTWRADLVAADRRGEFFLAQTAYICVAGKPAGAA